MTELESGKADMKKIKEDRIMGLLIKANVNFLQIMSIIMSFNYKWPTVVILLKFIKF
jgi:hypothetical protein